MRRQIHQWPVCIPTSASMPINRFNQKYEVSLFHFQTRFHAWDILPPGIFVCPHTIDQFISNVSGAKFNEYTNKTRWVNAQR